MIQKTLASLSIGLFVVCIPVLLLTGSIWWAVNSHWLYTSGFEKYDVAAATGLSQAELGRVASGFINYFNSDEDLINLTITVEGEIFELFTREEKIHFSDVKNLFRLDFRVLIVTAIYGGIYGAFLLWKKRYRLLCRAALAGSGLTLALMVIAGIAAALDFDRLFLGFHRFAFSNEYWSASGYMLRLFPGGFWYDAAIYCVAAATGAALAIGVVAGGYLWFKRRGNSD